MVSKMIRDGKITPGCLRSISGKKLIDRDKADKKLAENLDQIHNPRKRPQRKKPKQKDLISDEQKEIASKAGTSNMTLHEAQTWIARYKAALLKVELGKETGKLIEFDLAEKEVAIFVRNCRNALQAIPDRIGAELSAMTDPHEVTEKLRNEIDEALEELAR